MTLEEWEAKQKAGAPRPGVASAAASGPAIGSTGRGSSFGGAGTHGGLAIGLSSGFDKASKSQLERDEELARQLQRQLVSRVLCPPR